MGNLNRIAAATISEVRRNDRLEDAGWKDLNGNNIEKIVNWNQNDLLDDINKMYLKNPLARKMIKAKTNYAIGEGLIYQAEEEEVQDILDNYYDDTDNKWGIELENRINELSLNGEFLILPEVSENAGDVKIDIIYPGEISERFMKKKFSREPGAFRFGNEERKYKVIIYDDLKQSYEGDLFYFYVNKLSYMDYGLPDLIASRDWLKMYDKSLFATMSRVGMLLSFVWDVMIDTNEKSVIDNKIKFLQSNPPVPGSARVHNKNEVWQALSPSLNGSDMDAIYGLLKGQCLTESGTPEFVLGLGGDVNYATAKTMLTPYFKDIKSRQKYIEYMFRTQFDYVIWQKQAKGMLSSTVNTEYDVMLADPDSEKAKDYADTLLKFSTATIQLASNGLIQMDDAKKVVGLILNQLGVDVTQTEETTDEMVDMVASAVHKLNGLKAK